MFPILEQGEISAFLHLSSFYPSFPPSFLPSIFTSGFQMHGSRGEARILLTEKNQPLKVKLMSEMLAPAAQFRHQISKSSTHPDLFV